MICWKFELLEKEGKRVGIAMGLLLGRPSSHVQIHGFLAAAV